jgi:lipopolysaccharide biosynthesis regulator YciM
MLILARVNSKLKKYDEAVSYGMQALDASLKNNEAFFVNEVENELAAIYSNANKPDSAEKYASLALHGATQLKNYLVIQNSSLLLSGAFEKKRSRQKHTIFLKFQRLQKILLQTLTKPGR